jgi:hypothetical protein
VIGPELQVRCDVTLIPVGKPVLRVPLTTAVDNTVYNSLLKGVCIPSNE